MNSRSLHAHVMSFSIVFSGLLLAFCATMNGWDQVDQTQTLSAPLSNQTNIEFCIVIPSYNNTTWCIKNLESVFIQNYPHYRVIYIDDASTDGTALAVEQYIEEKKHAHRVTLLKNTERKGALENIYNAVHTCAPHEIVVTLDGDDWFAHDKVLTTLKDAYQNKNAWLTYGTYEEYPSGLRGGSEAYPQDIIADNRYREYYWFASHVRTFYAWLFKLIKREDLQDAGKFYPMTWDMAFMFPMLEMARYHAIYIPEVLYIYNRVNPINDDKVNRMLQMYYDRMIRSACRYEALADAAILASRST